MHAIGLTGGFCSGKTFVLKVLEEQGCYTMRADDLAKNIIFSPDSPVLQKIIAAFGPGIYDPEKGLDKEKFSRLLFEDHEKRNAHQRHRPPAGQRGAAKKDPRHRGDPAATTS